MGEKEYSKIYDVDGMYHPFPNSWDTVKGTLDYSNVGGQFGKMALKMLDIMMEKLSRKGQVVLNRILQLLSSDVYGKDLESEESICKPLIGYQGYKYTIECTQRKLAEILNLKQSYLSQGLKDLKENGIVIQKRGLIYINPLVYNKNNLFSLEVIKEFGLYVNPPTKEDNKKRSTEKVSRKKADPSKIRTDLGGF